MTDWNSPRFKRDLDRWIMRGPPEPPDDEEPEYCDSPGRGGCGCCPSCQDWADQKFEEKRDREMEER